MNRTCECGMTHETDRARSGCRECGTAVCETCRLEAEHEFYCRWCAASLSYAATV